MTVEKSTFLLPKLRFPEFRGAPGWQRRMMSRYLCESRIKGSGGHDAKKITVKLWGKGVVEKNENMRGSANTQYYKRRAGQFIYSKLDFLNQAFGIIPEHLDGFESTVDLPCFDVSPAINTKFLLEYVQREQFYKIHGEIADGGRKAKRIQVETFLECPIYAPSKPEQQKIADCLGSLDDLIAAEGRKLEALRRYKQGLMQQIFPQPGETVPSLRFPEFRDNGAWEEGKAGSLFMNRRDRGEEGLPIYSVTMHDGMVRRDSLNRDYYDIEEAAGNKTARKNDIVYNMMRMWQGAIGVAPEDCLVSPAYIVLIPQNHVVSKFFEYMFKLSSSMDILTSYSRGLTKDRLRLYYDDFARIPLYYPKNPEEQQRVASCLSSLDTMLSAQMQTLDVLRQHKQGLLQQLFPSLEEDDS